MGDALAYLKEARRAYVERYRHVIREERAKDANCVAEAWVRPKVGAGDDAPDVPEELCIDIMCGDPEKPQMISVSGDFAPQGAPVGAIRVGAVETKVYPIAWEICVVWMRHPQPDWSALEGWRRKWMDPDRGANPDDAEGLSGCVHYVGSPVAEGGGYFFELDFGSAPVEALTELLDVFATMGASEIEVGRSDGSDLDADVAREVARPDLSPERLTELLVVLLKRLEEVEGVEMVGPQKIHFKSKENGNEHKIFTANLYLRLQRVGAEQRVSEVWRFVRGQREGLHDRGPQDLSQLRPAIKDDLFFQQLPVGDDGKKIDVVARRLVGDLSVCVVWDTPHGMRFATEEEAGQYGLSVAEMHERAVKNYLSYCRARGQVEFAEHGPILVARTGDCYDATLLLDDGFWTEAAGKVKGQVLACVPARDVVLIGGTEWRGAVKAMREAAAAVIAGGDHLISETILVRAGKEWVVYEEGTELGLIGKRGRVDLKEDVSKSTKPWWKFW